jgi:hypothetical protein
MMMTHFLVWIHSAKLISKGNQCSMTLLWVTFIRLLWLHSLSCYSLVKLLLWGFLYQFHRYESIQFSSLTWWLSMFWWIHVLCEFNSWKLCSRGHQFWYRKLAGCSKSQMRLYTTTTTTTTTECLYAFWLRWRFLQNLQRSLYIRLNSRGDVLCLQCGDTRIVLEQMANLPQSIWILPLPYTKPIVHSTCVVLGPNQLQ